MAMNVCRNCKWAQWQMTAHNPPRVKKAAYGHCTYPVERIAIPMSLDSQARYIKESGKSAIWWTWEYQCRVWERAS